VAATWAADVGIGLDHRAEVPLGVQLDWAIRAAVAAGRLRPVERLPALRELADELGVNHNTLRAAVAKLEADGLLESRHGSGTFVAADAAAHERHAPLVEQAVQWAADAGLSPRELAAALYVAGQEQAPPDPEAEERRALRDEIAMLERLLARLERKLPVPPPADAPRARARGARVLTADELREERHALVRRLAAVQMALDDETDEPPSAPEPAPSPAAPARPRSAGALRPQPSS
jgi:DNA-binding transcriptional regulator YhcF (GntR family)